MDKLDVSVLILAKNEEKNIAAAIETCEFAREVLVIDDNSVDLTANIAKNLGAKVITHALDNDFAAQERFAIEHASSKFVFILDADERISPELQVSIAQVVAAGEEIVGVVRRQNNLRIVDARHGILRPDFVARLFPKKDLEVQGRVHQRYASPYKERILVGDLIHFPYFNWQQYWNKFNLYTALAAKDYQAKNKQFSFFRDILLRPFWAFLKVYFWHKGFLDGKIGFILAVNHAAYTMNKYARLMTKGKL